MAVTQSDSTLPAAPTEAPEPHPSYVPASVQMPEFTWPAVLVGALLGIVFGASSLYLVLKVGLTVSASIPVAVLSITLFRLFSRLPFIRRTTILENNIVQTTGSAGESIAFGVGVTMPALMILGFEMEIGRVMVVAVLGGLLGILMMIPLRRAFIVKQHGTLKYPEGTACADVLIVGEQGGASAKTVFVGFGIAFLYQFLWQGMKLWKETASKPLSWFKGATPAVEVNPALLGVGYIIGPRIACIMVAGGMLAAFVLTPAIHLFGDPVREPIYPATKELIRDMNDREVRDSYILYIGAGAVAAGGILSLFQALPLILGSITAGFRDLRRSGAGAEGGDTPRTDRDLPLWVVGAGSLGLVALIWLTSPLHERIPWVPDLQMHLVGAVLIVVFGFLFVTVSSRITGEIGSSSNPISGMTVATLLLTCLIFWALGWTAWQDSLTALSVAAVVCIAASNGGTTSQDLKTGYLIGATPKWQQLAIIVGALSSALVIGWILVNLNEAYTIYSKLPQNLPRLKAPVDVTDLPRAAAPGDPRLYPVWHALQGNAEGVPPGKYLLTPDGRAVAYLVDPGVNGKLSRRDDGTEVPRFYAPKAQLMALITTGILQNKLPWTLVLLGVSIAVVLELCGVSSLAFAVGVYLPLSASTPIFAGGLVRYAADTWGRSRANRSAAESDSSPGVLLATGYIAGGAIAGVVIGFLAFSDTISQALAVWEHRSYAVARQESFEDAYAAAARSELGLGESAELSQEESEEVADLAKAIRELNSNLLYLYVRVPGGTELKLPDGGVYRAPNGGYLGEVAREVLGSADRAQLLYTDNEGRLRMPETIPASAELKVPQRTTPALLAFGLLIVVLLLVGLGWLLQTPPAAHAALPPGRIPPHPGEHVTGNSPDAWPSAARPADAHAIRPKE